MNRSVILDFREGHVGFYFELYSVKWPGLGCVAGRDPRFKFLEI